MIIKYLLSLLLQLPILFSFAQQDSTAFRYQPNNIRVSSLILPAALTAYGFAALKIKALQSFDHNVREAVWLDNPHRPFPLDDYLQYAPGLAVYVLNAAGIKGRHDFMDRTVIYGMANVMMGIVVLSLKKAINAPRPDGSGNDGFPSGHAATAFVAAEFMRQEFKDISPWYGIAGYAAAVTTAFFRVYNDKHWFSETLSGAGIGMLAGRISYWVFPIIQKKLLKNKRKYIVL